LTQTKKRIVDEYLVACARLGDHAAQEKLVMRYQKQYLAHAYRLLGNAEQARDAVQEGWLDILRGLPGLRDDKVFQA
jgi:DNA-directed RNA polymerase specialized sigma24 family protein